MGASLKGQRKISVQGRTYYWHVAQDYDSAAMLLTAFSSDKTFIVCYELDQRPAHENVTVIGSTKEISESGGCWARFRSPRFAGKVATPSCVRRLIEWVLDEQIDRQPVDWAGRPI
jgi:hypothetical protein